MRDPAAKTTLVDLSKMFFFAECADDRNSIYELLSLAHETRDATNNLLIDYGNGVKNLSCRVLNKYTGDSKVEAKGVLRGVCPFHIPSEKSNRGYYHEIDPMAVERSKRDITYLFCGDPFDADRSMSF